MRRSKHVEFVHTFSFDDERELDVVICATIQPDSPGFYIEDVAAYDPVTEFSYNLTQAEEILWDKLRAKRLINYKFRKQYKVHGGAKIYQTEIQRI